MSSPRRSVGATAASNTDSNYEFKTKTTKITPTKPSSANQKGEKRSEVKISLKSTIDTDRRALSANNNLTTQGNEKSLRNDGKKQDRIATSGSVKTGSNLVQKRQSQTSQNVPKTATSSTRPRVDTGLAKIGSRSNLIQKKSSLTRQDSIPILAQGSFLSHDKPKPVLAKSGSRANLGKQSSRAALEKTKSKNSLSQNVVKPPALTKTDSKVGLAKVGSRTSLQSQTAPRTSKTLQSGNEPAAKRATRKTGFVNSPATSGRQHKQQLSSTKLKPRNSEPQLLNASVKKIKPLATRNSSPSLRAVNLKANHVAMKSQTPVISSQKSARTPSIGQKKSQTLAPKLSLVQKPSQRDELRRTASQRSSLIKSTIVTTPKTSLSNKGQKTSLTKTRSQTAIVKTASKTSIKSAKPLNSTGSRASLKSRNSEQCLTSRQAKSSLAKSQSLQPKTAERRAELAKRNSARHLTKRSTSEKLPLNSSFKSKKMSLMAAPSIVGAGGEKVRKKSTINRIFSGVKLTAQNSTNSLIKRVVGR